MAYEYKLGLYHIRNLNESVKYFKMFGFELF